jgi:hypothetical protein
LIIGKKAAVLDLWIIADRATDIRRLNIRFEGTERMNLYIDASQPMLAWSFGKVPEK